MKKRTKKILAWIAGIIGALLIAAMVWGYLYFYKPDKLFRAMVDNNQAEVIRLIDEEGYDPNMKLLNHKDIFLLYLFETAGNGNVDMVKILLNRGLRFNTENSFDNTLHSAARFGQIEIVKLLLSKGLDVNAYFIIHGKKLSVLEGALLPYQPEMAALLSKHGADFADYYDDNRIVFATVACVEQKICPPSLLDKLRHKGISQETINKYQEKYLKRNLGAIK